MQIWHSLWRLCLFRNENMPLNYLAGRITGLQKVAAEEGGGLEFPHAGARQLVAGVFLWQEAWRGLGVDGNFPPCCTGQRGQPSPRSHRCVTFAYSDQNRHRCSPVWAQASPGRKALCVHRSVKNPLKRTVEGQTGRLWSSMPHCGSRFSTAGSGEFKSRLSRVQAVCPGAGPGSQSVGALV